MFKLVDLYIARTILGTIFVTLSVLIGLSALIKFVEQLRRVGQGDYDMTLAALHIRRLKGHRPLVGCVSIRQFVHQS